MKAAVTRNVPHAERYLHGHLREATELCRRYDPFGSMHSAEVLQAQFTFKFLVLPEQLGGPDVIFCGA